MVRGSGPKGAPGMPCLYGSVWLLKSLGLDERVALVTDGRLSGTIRGLAVAHVSPEAGEAGPLAVVRDGDEIAIDIEERRLDLLIPEDELPQRVAACAPVRGHAGRGALAQYGRWWGRRTKEPCCGPTGWFLRTGRGIGVNSRRLGAMSAGPADAPAAAEATPRSTPSAPGAGPVQPARCDRGGLPSRPLLL